jgi:hypothetical protein
MPAYEEKGIYSGEDLAKLILETIPDCRIIFRTMFTELLKIKTINPHWLIIKSDLTFDELLLAFDKVIKNEQHYSQSALKMLELQEHTVEIDLFDKQILFCLSKEIEAKFIPQYIPMSSNAIEVRKLNRKLLLKVPERRAIPTCCAKPEILDYYFKKGKNGIL